VNSSNFYIQVTHHGINHVEPHEEMCHIYTKTLFTYDILTKEKVRDSNDNESLWSGCEL